MMETANKKEEQFFTDLLEQTDAQERDDIMKRMELATYIADVMKSMGLTQKELASRLQKKPSEVSRWLSGTHHFSTKTLWAIEKELGIRLINTHASSASEGVLLIASMSVAKLEGAKRTSFPREAEWVSLNKINVTRH